MKDILEQRLGAKEKKILRIFCKINDGTSVICIDRLYDSAKSDQENCDTAVENLFKAMQDGSCIPASRDISVGDQKAIEHLMINLGAIGVVTIIDVRIYTVGDKK